jgi:hypothetical protein
MKKEKLEKNTKWDKSRAGELCSLITLLNKVSSMNKSSGIIEAITLCSNIADDLITSNCETLRKSFIQFLEDQCIESRSEAADIIKELLKGAPRGHCCEMHHEKKDRHRIDEPCPLEQRWRQVIKRAEDFISKTK